VNRRKSASEKVARHAIEARLACIVAAIEEKKGEQIVVLDLQKIQNAICRYMVITHGSSSTHIRAITDFIIEQCEKFFRELPYAIDDASENWIVLDYLDIVVHIFDEKTRSYYLLEELWGDALPVKLTELPLSEQKEKFADEIESHA
jgi:ribosome-associated protein